MVVKPFGVHQRRRYNPRPLGVYIIVCGLVALCGDWVIGLGLIAVGLLTVVAGCVLGAPSLLDEVLRDDEPHR